MHAGYACAPYLGRLLADRILERKPEMEFPAAFDPARLLVGVKDFFADAKSSTGLRR